MCGRFGQYHLPSELLREVFRLTELPSVHTRYNLAPGEDVLTVGTNPETGDRSGTYLRWGLIPSWMNNPGDANASMINARAETVDEKPSFRKPFRNQRCIIPANGFYEWKPNGEDGKQPFFVKPTNEPFFGLAGLWDHWRGQETVVHSCTILTTEANEALEDVHERMPVIVSPDDYDTWLDPDVKDSAVLRPLLTPYSPAETECYPVSRRVNRPDHDAPDCVEPLTT